MNVRAHNRIAWDKQVEYGNQWTVPVSPEAVAAARKGRWEIYLTPSRPVPRDWFPELPGSDVLCLASGGGRPRDRAGQLAPPVGAGSHGRRAAGRVR